MPCRACGDLEVAASGPARNGCSTSCAEGERRRNKIKQSGTRDTVDEHLAAIGPRMPSRRAHERGLAGAVEPDDHVRISPEACVRCDAAKPRPAAERAHEAASSESEGPRRRDSIATNSMRCMLVARVSAARRWASGGPRPPRLAPRARPVARLRRGRGAGGPRALRSLESATRTGGRWCRGAPSPPSAPSTAAATRRRCELPLRGARRVRRLQVGEGLFRDQHGSLRFVFVLVTLLAKAGGRNRGDAVFRGHDGRRE